jgi:uncharacterized protein with PQ loop repeat
MDFFTAAIGFSGMALVLFAFLMNQFRKWNSESVAYDAANAAGSALLVIYAIILKSYPFLILNAVWAIVSARDIVLDIKAKKENKDENSKKKSNEKPNAKPMEKPKAKIGHKAK